MAVAQDPSALLEHIRRLEDAGDVKEATALARAAVADGTGGYDWSAEVMRLDAEGKLARPYREGLEALAEGDYADAQRLLGWVAGKNPKYREVARHLYWAVEGRDPGAATNPGDEDPAPPTRAGARTALMSPLSLLFAVALVGLGLLVGYVFALSKTPAPPPVAVTTPGPIQAAPVAAPVTTPTPAPVQAAPPPVELVASAPPEAPAAPAPVEAAPAPPPEPARDRAPSTSTPKTPPPSAADRANAAALGCQDGEARACFDLGDAYYYGRGTSKSMSQAMSAYARSCDHGHARGCFNAGDMVENAEAGPADPRRALELYARGCTLGDSDACTRKVLLEVTSK